LDRERESLLCQAQSAKELARDLQSRLDEKADDNEKLSAALERVINDFLDLCRRHESSVCEISALRLSYSLMEEKTERIGNRMEAEAERITNLSRYCIVAR
jgi:hemerythrin-like domain-containing protein